MGSAGSWYLSEIYYERIWYHQAPNAGLGYTIGRGIFLALASGLLGIISGKFGLHLGLAKVETAYWNLHIKTKPNWRIKSVNFNSVVINSTTGNRNRHPKRLRTLVKDSFWCSF